MKKIITNFILLIIILFITLIALLSTLGFETDKFNKFIIDRSSQTKNINLELDKIKFKINLKELSLFLETNNPKIAYREVSIPVKNIKVFVDFFSLLDIDPKITKTSLTFQELDIVQLNKLSQIIKPSNFKSLLNNRIKEGKLISEVDIFLTEKGSFKDFIARGTIKGLKVDLQNNLSFKNVNLGFFADKNDILIKNIFGELEEIKISDGDIKVNLENGVHLVSNFKSKFDFNKDLLSKYSKYLDKFALVKDFKNLKANLNNNLTISFDKTYKVEDYNYKISGNIEKGNIKFKDPIKYVFLEKEIKSLQISNLNLSSNIKKNEINFKAEGKYALNLSDFMSISIENNSKNDLANLILDFDFDESLQVDFINYKKPKNSIASISLNFEKAKNTFKINGLQYQEAKNLIKIKDFVFKKKKYSSFRSIEVFTKNNEFLITNNNKIEIRGKKFDASNVAKYFGNKGGENIFQELNRNIEIDFENIKVPMSEKLKNFKLIGEIKRGQFTKISSKGDFGGNNFLDISLKKDKNTNKKYLEIYSDLPRPLLAEYSFFKGLSGGKLLYTSIIDGTLSNSKLKIEDFKVINAPGVVKLLSLADLGGLADLAEGEGLSFNLLEIDMEKNKNFLKLNEILALGPSMSVLMEGYQDENNVTSLRGTLVPAKTLNKMIAKIPVIGNIVIPKEVGEGLFGISFKMKGPKGKIKTTINPIKTITPRFIQKIIDRNKVAK